MNPAEILSKPLTLKNGAVIPNRFAGQAEPEDAEQGAGGAQRGAIPEGVAGDVCHAPCA